MQGRAVQLLLLLVVLSLLSSCGFKLRGAPVWPVALQPVATEAVPQGRDFVQQLRLTLVEQGVSLSGAAAARIVVHDESHKRRVQSLDANGRVNAYQLNYGVTLSLIDASGVELLAAESYRYQRSYAYNANRALGHQWQEQEMLQRMRQQAIDAFMQRVALGQYAGATE